MRAGCMDVTHESDYIPYLDLVRWTDLFVGVLGGPGASSVAGVRPACLSDACIPRWPCVVSGHRLQWPQGTPLVGETVFVSYSYLIFVNTNTTLCM